MNVEGFLLIYIILVVIAVSLEVYLLVNDKYRYVKTSMSHLSRLVERNSNMDTVELMARELKRLYTQYVREYSRFVKFYSNIIVWLDAIIFCIDTNKKVPQLLLDKEATIKEARELLEKEKPFYHCNEYQQEILIDISKLEDEENAIIVKNILDRASTEFIRQNTDNTRNRILNTVSVIIGLTGIFVSIIFGMVS